MTKKPIKKPTKKTAIKKAKAVPKKPVKLAIEKNPLIARAEKNPLVARIASLEATLASAAVDLKAAQADKKAAVKNTKRIGELADERIASLRELLVKACEHALNAADAIASERIVEAEEDFCFRADIEAIRVASDITLRGREPKTKLDAAGEEYVWIGDEEDGDNGDVIQAASVAAPVTPVVEQRADHGGGMSGHDEDEDEDDEVSDAVSLISPELLRMRYYGIIASASERAPDASDYGVTVDEIEAVTKDIHQIAAARCAELEHAGLIADSGRTRMTRHGRQAVVLVVTGKAPPVWNPTDAGDAAHANAV